MVLAWRPLRYGMGFWLGLAPGGIFIFWRIDAGFPTQRTLWWEAWRLIQKPDDLVVLILSLPDRKDSRD
jgi:hypothetical protein